MKADGGWGWVIMVASFLMNVLIDGVKYSFGIIFIELIESFNGSKSETAWILSIQIGVMLLSGPILAALVNRFGCKTVAVIGTVFSSGGFIASAFVTSVHALYATFGFVAGLGFGMMSLSSCVMLVKYFDKRLAFANGFSTMGSGVGALVFNPLGKILIDEYTWRGTMLVEAGMIFNGLACALVYRPPDTDADKTARKRYDTSDKDDLYEIEEMHNIKHDNDNNRIASDIQVESEFTWNVKYSSKNKTKTCNLNLCKHVQSKNENKHISLHILPANDSNISFPCHEEDELQTKQKRDKFKKNRWISILPLKNPGFIVFLISNVLIELSLSIPHTYIPDMMKLDGFEIKDAVWIIFIISALNIISRLVIGIIADLPVVNRVKLCNSLVMFTGVLVILCPFCFNFASFVAFAVFYGITSGSSNSLRGVLIPDLFGSDTIADHFGITMFFGGMAALIGLPISGAIHDATGSYRLPFILAGAELIISGTLLFLIPKIQFRWQSKRTR